MMVSTVVLTTAGMALIRKASDEGNCVAECLDSPGSSLYIQCKNMGNSVCSQYDESRDGAGVPLAVIGLVAH
jgi:hypothetical protein